MHRRTFLASCGVTAAMGVAGCGGSARDNPADTDAQTSETPSETTTVTTIPAPSLAGQSITTTKAKCGTTDGSATVSFDTEGTAVSIDGALSASDPCHEATLVGADYAADSETLTVTVGTEVKDKICVDCVGRIEYAATVDFDNGLPGRVVVKHGKKDPATVADVTRE